VPAFSTAEATQAVEAAERAFPAWAKLTAKQRSNILRKWFDLIIANREDLALILTSEQGKPLPEALGEGRYRRRLCRIFRRGGPPRLWRNHPDAAARCAACSRSSSRSASAAPSRRGISRAR
jgi:acyl-CoA reductase-like NAD-dependent aldehyde dehydrogenase